MTGSQTQASFRRRVAVAAVLMVAIAVLLLIFRSPFEQPAADVTEDSFGTGPAEVQLSPIPEVESSVDAVPPGAGASSSVASAGPNTIIVLPSRIADPDRATEAFVDAVRQAMMRSLQARANLLIVEITAADFDAVVPPGAGGIRDTRPAYLALARRYGGGHVVAISERSSAGDGWWSVQMQVHSEMDYGGSGISMPEIDHPSFAAKLRADAESTGRMFAMIILGEVSEQSSLRQPASDTRRDFLDTTRSDEQRLESLAELRRIGVDRETIAAAAEMAMRSASAETRREVWKALRQDVYDPALAQPLGYALLSDPDATVRREAALALAPYLEEANTRSVLESALRNDASAEVRLAARLSMMDYEEQQAFARTSLLDRSLSPAERLAPTLLNQESPIPRLAEPDVEALREMAGAYAEIVAGTDDPDLKLNSLSELNDVATRAPGRLQPEIVEVLIESVDVADEDIQRIAVGLLRRAVANPEVRAVLEQVLENDPELAEELQIPKVLEWSGPGEPDWLRI